jgi:hypothetical protein
MNQKKQNKNARANERNPDSTPSSGTEPDQARKQLIKLALLTLLRDLKYKTLN